MSPTTTVSIQLSVEYFGYLQSLGLSDSQITQNKSTERERCRQTSTLSSQSLSPSDTSQLKPKSYFNHADTATSMPYLLTRCIIFTSSFPSCQLPGLSFFFFSPLARTLTAVLKLTDIKTFIFLHFKSVTGLDPQRMNICCICYQFISLSTAPGTNLSNCEHSPGTKKKKKKSCSSFLEKTSRNLLEEKHTYS